GQVVSAWDLGPQRYSPVDRSECVAVTVRAGVARSHALKAAGAGSAQFGAEITDGVAEFFEDLVVRHHETVVDIDLFGGVVGDAPAGGGQVFGGRTAFTEPDEFGDVDVEPVLTPVAAHRPSPFVGEHAHIGDVLRGQPAARCAERRDVVQQSVLGFRREVGQQAFGDPG